MEIYISITTLTLNEKAVYLSVTFLIQSGILY